MYMDDGMSENINCPKVSVCVITYNQEKYIRQCLQSIVDQVTDFDFEIIVGDDCSTDGTRMIIEEFVQLYPRIVKPLFQTKNIDGGNTNFRTVHNHASGMYVAHVDGDDYTLPGKLQEQADLLDREPGCNIVYHRMILEFSNGDTCEGPLFDIKDIVNYKFYRGELIQYVAVGLHSSKMYRRSSWRIEEPIFGLIDFYVNVEQIGLGYAKYVGHKALGVYRVDVGISSSGPRSRRILSECLLYFHKKFPEHRREINTAALTYLLGDLKNFRSTSLLFFVIWIKTFHIGAFLRFYKSYRLTKSFGLKNRII